MNVMNTKINIKNAKNDLNNLILADSKCNKMEEFQFQTLINNFNSRYCHNYISVPKKQKKHHRKSK